MALGKRAREFADAEEFEADGGGPIVERRLLEPGLAVEARGDEVAGFGHVAGDPGVARFVWADQADGAEMGEVADVESREDKDEPEDCRKSRECVRFVVRAVAGRAMEAPRGRV